MFSLSVSKDVKKFISSRDRKTRNKIITSLEALSKDPFENLLDIKPMKGMGNHYRLRIGKYRFLYEILNEKILIYIYHAGSRGDVYKK